jgi:hypothetical protein
VIRPPRQRSKAGGLQRRTEVASCAPPELGKSSAERPRCKHRNEDEPRHGSSSLLAATYGSLQDRLRPAHDRQGCTEIRRGASPGLLRPVLRSFHASFNASSHSRGHRTFGHGVQACPLPYQRIWGHCTIQLVGEMLCRVENTQLAATLTDALGTHLTLVRALRL